MRSYVSGNVTEYDSAPVISYLKGRSDIEVHLGIAHDGTIDEKRLFVSRLAMFHVDLSGHALHTVDHR